MKKLKLYLETSVWNFYYADDAPEKRDITIKFFDIIRTGKYEIFISQIVIDEINEADYDKKKLLITLIDEINPTYLSVSEEVRHLAKLYITNGIIPVKKVEDSLHTSISTIYEMDALLSWNYRHLVSNKRKLMINETNWNKGYFKYIKLMTPEEAILL